MSRKDHSGLYKALKKKKDGKAKRRGGVRLSLLILDLRDGKFTGFRKARRR